MRPSPETATVVFRGSTSLALATVTELEGVAVFEDQTHPSIETDGKQFMIVYAESYNGNLSDYDVYAATLWFIDGARGISDAHQNLDFSSDTSLDPCIAANGSAGTPGTRAASVWTRRATGSDGDIHGALYDAP